MNVTSSALSILSVEQQEQLNEIINQVDDVFEMTDSILNVADQYEQQLDTLLEVIETGIQVTQEVFNNLDVIQTEISQILEEVANGEIDLSENAVAELENLLNRIDNVVENGHNGQTDSITSPCVLHFKPTANQRFGFDSYDGYLGAKYSKIIFNGDQEYYVPYKSVGTRYGDELLLDFILNRFQKYQINLSIMPND